MGSLSVDGWTLCQKTIHTICLYVWPGCSGLIIGVRPEMKHHKGNLKGLGKTGHMTAQVNVNGKEVEEMVEEGKQAL